MLLEAAVLCVRVTFSAGAGVASAVWPGTGTLLGYNAADLALAFMLVNPLVDKWFGGLPPPAALDAARTGGPPRKHPISHPIPCL